MEIVLLRGTYYVQNALERFFSQIFGQGTFRVEVSNHTLRRMVVYFMSVEALLLTPHW